MSIDVRAFNCWWAEQSASEGFGPDLVAACHIAWIAALNAAIEEERSQPSPDWAVVERLQNLRGPENP